HARAHGDKAALFYSFEEVLAAYHDPVETQSPECPPNKLAEYIGFGFNKRTMKRAVNRDKNLVDLAERCVKPGYYARNLANWLKYYPSNQILLVDGDELRLNPIPLMQKVQIFAGFENSVNYSSLIFYDSQKGFFCASNELNLIPGSGWRSCLGGSKGRDYIHLDTAIYVPKLSWLYYCQDILALVHLLNTTRFYATDADSPWPTWLQKLIYKPVQGSTSVPTCCPKNHLCLLTLSPLFTFASVIFFYLYRIYVYLPYFDI
ncbi:unnamed protein product, partial [Protopolystoma xenopodis]